MDKPKTFVTVIIPFYNSEGFLAEAIDSVLTQTYTYWQLLIVDDGSAHASTSIARKYADAHPDKIIYLEHSGHANKGVGATRNLGIAHAAAPYIAFLDHDDTWLPEKLEMQVKLIEQYPQAGMFCEASEYWYSWENDSRQDEIIFVGKQHSGLYQPPLLLQQLYPFGNGAAPCPCAVIVKKTVLVAIGGFEESFIGTYQLYEDQVLLSKIYLQHSVYISTDCNNRYRQHSTSAMAKIVAKGKYHKVRKYFLRYFETYLKTNGLYTTLTKQLLYEAWQPYGLKSQFKKILKKAAGYLKKI